MKNQLIASALLAISSTLAIAPLSAENWPATYRNCINTIRGNNLGISPNVAASYCGCMITQASNRWSSYQYTQNPNWFNRQLVNEGVANRCTSIANGRNQPSNNSNYNHPQTASATSRGRGRSQQFRGVIFTLQGCGKEGNEIRCKITALNNTSQTVEVDTSWYGGSRLFFSSGEFSNGNDDPGSTNIPVGVSVKFDLVFPAKNGSIVQLELNGGVQNNTFTLNFR